MITTLANGKDQSNKLDTTLRTILMVGQAVNVAVERFVATGEAIADDNPEIKVEMHDACKDARAAGAAIEKICEVQYNDQHTSNRCYSDKSALTRAARGLLTSVTRVLLLADNVVVKQLLAANNKAAMSLNKLENVANFTEFVKAFSLFGIEVVEFSSLIGDQQNEFKHERRRAQMVAARQILQRSTTVLLTSSKTCLRHMDCQSARENRDTVFCQMRKAVDLIHFVIKDGVMDMGSGTDSDQTFNRQLSSLASQQQRIPDDWDNLSTVQCAIKKFEDIVQMTRMTLVGPSYRGKLTGSLDTIVERTQDFTDSAYTSHEHRENILLLCDRTKLELNQLLRIGISMDQQEIVSPNEELEAAIVRTLRAIKDVKQQLQDTALDQASDLFKAEDMDLIGITKNAALASDASKVEECSERFHDHVEHIQEVCKLLQHVAIIDSLQVAAKHAENNIKVYGPQVLCAAHTLCLYPTSKTAKENVEMFIETWQALVSDVMSLSREVGEICRGRIVENPVYMSLPRPGKHGTTSKPLKPASLDSEEQAKIAESGLEMKKITSEMDAETEKWEESDSDVVKRAKAMSAMAFAMYQFTRGEGELRTTQDLFTQAEFFTEEANKLYKVVRQFSYQVPVGQNKKELLEFLDKVPTFVQQLQFTVKNPTVGKAATFTKVDNVIQETKNLMNVISKVVTTCFVCATKYNLDFNALTASRRSSPYGEMDGGASGLSETPSGIGSKGGGSSSDGNM
ncbi:myosin 3, variant 2 [Chamberlinius hualienensis]